MPLEGIARTERQAPAVRAILKQTPSPVRGLSLGLWKWEWDWTVQACWKYSRSTFFFFFFFTPWMFQMPQIGRMKKTQSPFSLKLFVNISHLHWGANICIKPENLPDSVTALLGKGSRASKYKNPWEIARCEIPHEEWTLGGKHSLHFAWHLLSEIQPSTRRPV